MADLNLDFTWFFISKQGLLFLHDCLSFIFYLGKEISAFVTGICKSVDELARNSNVIILVFLVFCNANALRVDGVCVCVKPQNNLNLRK